MMTTEQKQFITATVPVLRENGVLLTTHFYQRMFTHNPELKNIFNMGNQESSRQPTALAMAVLGYAENIANPAVLMPVVDRIGHKHTSLNIRPEQYAIVGHHLIESIKEVLGEAATPEIIDAWTAAYTQLAQLMSGHEAGLYSAQAAAPHGWTGWRPFKVIKKVQESAEITSFYLSPAEEGKVPTHQPGQYISIKLFMESLGYYQTRQYSLSCAPNNDYYRISVKKEKGLQLDENGLISNYLHDNVNEGDVVDITSPAGTFTLPEDKETPLMFISGGVGLTPFISMLHALANNETKAPVTWIHGCRSKEVHAFETEIAAAGLKHQQFNQHVFYNNAGVEDLEKGIKQGFLDLNALTLEHPEKTQYYICGPSAFIKKQCVDLIDLGIDPSALHYEEFGPAVLAI